jgi:hypothetical protein
LKVHMVMNLTSFFSKFKALTFSQPMKSVN